MAGTQLQIMAVGSTISLLQNGVTRVSVTDTSFTGGAPGADHPHDRVIPDVSERPEHGAVEKPTVEGLAGMVHLSKRSFIRRFKAATGNTPIEYIQRMNVEKAKRQLENSKDSIEQIIYSLGYNDIHSFRKVFTRYTDLTLKEYRGRYGA